METNLEVVGGVAVLEVLAASLDASNADAARRRLADLAAVHPRLVVDLSRVQFLDSAGCGALVASRAKFRAAGGELRLCRPTAEVRMLLEMLQLDKLLGLDPTREAAVAALGG